jgi:hypothetical protein
LIWDSGKQAANAPVARAVAPSISIFRGKRLEARIAKQRDKFNGDGHLAEKLALSGFPGLWNRKLKGPTSALS